MFPHIFLQTAILRTAFVNSRAVIEISFLLLRAAPFCRVSATFSHDIVDNRLCLPLHARAALSSDIIWISKKFVDMTQTATNAYTRMNSNKNNKTYKQQEFLYSIH